MKPSDYNNHPCFMFCKGDLLPLEKELSRWDGYQRHHKITQSTLRANPERIQEQKIIYMPTDVHINLHGSMSQKRFKKLYGIEKKELLYKRNFR